MQPPHEPPGPGQPPDEPEPTAPIPPAEPAPREPYGQPPSGPAPREEQPPYGRPSHETPPPHEGYPPPPLYSAPPYGGTPYGHRGVPEGVRLAGRWRRLFAGILDGVIVNVIASPFTLRTGAGNAFDMKTGSWHFERVSTGSWLAAMAIVFLYYWLFHAYWNGQTPGKRVFGMRVVREVDGGKISSGQAAGRIAFSILLSLVCCISIIDVAWILFDPRKQALHDKVARTLVADTQVR
ncbi:RDD family protein [Rhizohabitans arisaemae]|uniref:RDD family protein n=1 Tax=Rhizohabitans arisaemae TaxID=2720610 RepID=UPI0024B155FF|nr:RDD family protein [Rhizohabitans arisaemae]